MSSALQLRLVFSLTRHLRLTTISSLSHSTIAAPARCELDSHADTCCCGTNFRLLATAGETVSVAPFIKAYEPLQDVPIATCATSITDPSNGQTFVLIFHESLFFGPKMDHSLICPNQLRFNGLRVHDTPKQFDRTSLHGITFQNQFFLPFQLHGIISYFNSRPPTNDELEHCTRLDVTSDIPWDPYSSDFLHRESRISAVSVNGDCPCASSQQQISELVHSFDELTFDQDYSDRLVESIQVPPSSFRCSRLRWINRLS